MAAFAHAHDHYPALNGEHGRYRVREGLTRAQFEAQQRITFNVKSLVRQLYGPLS